MPIQQETYVYGEVTLPYWGASIPVAWPKGNRTEQYVPFRVMCKVIGVERKRQLSVIKSKYRVALRMIPLETATGLHQAMWIRRPECALWVGDIDPRRCKITSRGPLEKFREDFKDAADKLMFEGPRAPAGKRGIIASSERMEYIFSCLYCGGGHRILAQNGEVTIERYVV